MRDLLKMWWFPLAGLVIAPSYFYYKIAFDANHLIPLEIILFPVDVFIPIFSLLSIFIGNLTLLKIYVISIYAILGFLTFFSYQMLYLKLKSDTKTVDFSSKLKLWIRYLFGYVLIIFILWAMANLSISTHAFTSAKNIYTGECKSFGGPIPLGYVSDNTCKTMHGIPEFIPNPQEFKDDLQKPLNDN
jgi:hypothetical protein